MTAAIRQPSAGLTKHVGGELRLLHVAALQRGGDLPAKLRDLLSGASARPAKHASKAAARTPRKATRRAGRPAKDAKGCAILGCPRPSRSKGYCSAHYQKRRNLQKTKRLPSDWKEDAAPGTVKDLVLPRGRRAATPSGAHPTRSPEARG